MLTSPARQPLNRWLTCRTATDAVHLCAWLLKIAVSALDKGRHSVKVSFTDRRQLSSDNQKVSEAKHTQLYNICRVTIQLNSRTRQGNSGALHTSLHCIREVDTLPLDRKQHSEERCLASRYLQTLPSLAAQHPVSAAELPHE